MLLLVPVIAHSIRATDREYTQDRIGPDWNKGESAGLISVRPLLGKQQQQQSMTLITVTL